eukprot:246705-Chlamydomonas_euryale.AAC.2
MHGGRAVCASNRDTDFAGFLQNASARWPAVEAASARGRAAALNDELPPAAFDEQLPPAAERAGWTGCASWNIGCTLRAGGSARAASA